MIETLLTLGWKGDFYKLYKASQHRNNILGRMAFKLFCKKRQCYFGKNSVIASDVVFPHMTGIHVASYARIGKGCTIYQNVTLGANRLEGTKHWGVPTIGNNVLIGANACVIGGVKIADNVRIGAGCVVVEDVPEGAVVVTNKPRIITKHVED